jgi:natural product biosynthesis luciferase-like monooxygenase protein
MFSGIETVQKLWRGESILLPNGVGEETEIKIYPLPKQQELPVWITCSGGKERFIEAGAVGAKILTALLFQPIEELAEKIALYRDSLVKHGHAPEAGHVTLMLHTFVAEDIAVVRNKVQRSFTEYLKTSVDLWRHGSKNLDDLTEKERQDLLAYAFERYFQTSALFGTPDTCLKMVARLKEIGVDEIACLIDFGVDVDSVMTALHSLKRLKDDCHLGINPDTRQQDDHQHSQTNISDEIDPGKAEQLLTKIEQLSDGEVDSLLSELLAAEEVGK